METSITKHQSYKQTDIDDKYIIDIICANYVQSKTFLDVLSWKLDRMYSVLWGTKRWKIIYNKRKYSKFYNCGGAKWPIKEAKPTFWCFEKTGPPSQKYNSWRWGKNTTQLQLPPPLDLCENLERTRFRTMCGVVSTLWICVKLQIHWIADPSFKCQRNTFPSNLTLLNLLISSSSHLVKQVLDKTERRFPEEVANSRTSFRRKRTWVSSNRQPNFGSVPYT